MLREYSTSWLAGKDFRVYASVADCRWVVGIIIGCLLAWRGGFISALSERRWSGGGTLCPQRRGSAGLVAHHTTTSPDS